MFVVFAAVFLFLVFVWASFADHHVKVVHAREAEVAQKHQKSKLVKVMSL